MLLLSFFLNPSPPKHITSHYLLIRWNSTVDKLVCSRITLQNSSCTSMKTKRFETFSYMAWCHIYASSCQFLFSNWSFKCKPAFMLNLCCQKFLCGHFVCSTAKTKLNHCHDLPQPSFILSALQKKKEI